MTTQDFISALFYAVDQARLAVPKHPDAQRYPSEVVTLGLLHALQGGGTRTFYRWLTRDYLPLFPQVPERTRLARLFKPHTAWTTRFLAMPTVGRRGQLWDRVAPHQAGRTELGPDRQEGAEQAALDYRRHNMFYPEAVGLAWCLGLHHRQCP